MDYKRYGDGRPRDLDRVSYATKIDMFCPDNDRATGRRNDRRSYGGVGAWVEIAGLRAVTRWRVRERSLR